MLHSRIRGYSLTEKKKKNYVCNRAHGLGPNSRPTSGLIWIVPVYSFEKCYPSENIFRI
jgi:hypothetical protein